MYDKQCLLQVIFLKQPIFNLKAVLILLNKYSPRNTIATKIKIAIAINVISIKLVRISIYLSWKRKEMGKYHY